MTAKSVATQILTDGKFTGIFPGWGGKRILAINYKTPEDLNVIADTSSLQPKDQQNHPKHHVGLNTIMSVSIAGCDLMGSALYTAGTCAAYSGKLAPVGLTLVTIMLYLFRKPYNEVVTGIPVNGGTYNLMLNTVSKKIAGFVACLSFLSYLATAIVSAFAAVIFMSELWADCDIRLFTVLILLFFGALTICGVKESATVTLCMFTLHIFTLTLLIVWGFAYGCQDKFSLFSQNVRTPVPEIRSATGDLLGRRSPGAAIYFGYSSGLLGITGFETASNYVEELAEIDIFLSTVNWMWFFVGIYNPLLSLVSMMVLDMNTIYEHPSNLLAVFAEKLGGKGLKVFFCIDAIVVLCGGVLTAILGVSGLIDRLSNDRILPQSLTYRNIRGAPYVTIIMFVILAITLFLAIFDPADPTGIANFGGVFTIAFLSVLTCFGVGAILVKLYRPKLARLVISKWWEVFLATGCIVIGLIGNIILTPGVFYLFLAYLSGFLLVVWYMFMRVEILSFGIWMIRRIWRTNDIEQKEDEEEVHIIEACRQQYRYDEEMHLEDLKIDKKQLQQAVHKTMMNSSQQQMPQQPQQSEKESIIEQGTLLENQGQEIHNQTPNLIEFIQQIFSSSAIMTGNVRYYDRASSKSANDLEHLLQKRFIGKYLQYLMTSLDELVSSPFCYLAKKSDPISLQLAINYIDANELSNNIYILHFVDDRKVIHARKEYEKHHNRDQHPPHDMNDDDNHHHHHQQHPHHDQIDDRRETNKFIAGNGFVLDLLLKQKEKNRKNSHSQEKISLDQNHNSNKEDEEVQIQGKFTLESTLPTLPYETQELIHNVAVLDAFYTYKKIHAIIIRGGFFTPSCLDCVASFLQLRKNDMIMGVPDTTLPFPFAKLNGCRIAIPDADAKVRHHSSAHLRNVLEETATSILTHRRRRTRGLVSAHSSAQQSSTVPDEEDDINDDELGEDSEGGGSLRKDD